MRAIHPMLAKMKVCEYTLILVVHEIDAAKGNESYMHVRDEYTVEVMGSYVRQNVEVMNAYFKQSVE
ncbi:hypothetical protein KI387_037196, partial [Taxus chinensis]